MFCFTIAASAGGLRAAGARRAEDRGLKHYCYINTITSYVLSINYVLFTDTLTLLLLLAQFYY